MPDSNTNTNAHKLILPLAGLILPTAISFGLSLSSPGRSLSGVLTGEDARVLMTNYILLFGPGVVGLLLALFVALPRWETSKQKALSMWFGFTLLGSAVMVAAALALTP